MLLICVVIAVVFFINSMSLPPSPTSKTMGPSFFPRLISIFLVISCAASFITTYKKKADKKIKLGNMKLIITTVLATFLFVLAWHLSGLFYPCAFTVLAVLVYIYNQEKHSPKKVLKSCSISLTLVLFVYVVFQRLLNVTFSV